MINAVVNMIKELPELTRNHYNVRSAIRLTDKWELNMEDYHIEYGW